MIPLMRRSLLVVCLLAIVTPMVASAFPFGGRITLYHVCYNETLFARLSPPVPGDYVWTTATKTYLFGPPRAVGQWLLGLTGIPFDCLWSVNPIFPVPAIAIMMMGSSGPAAPMSPGGSFGAMPSAPTGNAPGTGGAGYSPDPTNPWGQSSPVNNPAQTGRVLITEVFYNVDAAHGSKPTHEWVEIYNGTTATVNIGGWTVQDGTLSDVIPSGTQIAASSRIIIAQSADVRAKWNIPSTITVVALNSPIGDGLATAGDVVRLRNSTTAIVDAFSWGTNTSAFSPAATAVAAGHSHTRISLIYDNDNANDWRDEAMPNPGF